jgi:uncharacterized membrane protein YeaQ/YmgE (transglycosylase-associated protein family)
VIQSALLGGLFIGILSALPVIQIANCCCLWMTSGGLLAGYLLPQWDPPLTKPRGALAGLLAGVVGAFVWLIAASALDALMAPLMERLIEDAMASADDMPPQARAWFEMMGNRGSAAFRLTMGFMFQLSAGFVFATLGGLLAAVFFGKAVPPPPTQGDIAPPPLPPLP